MRTWNLSLLIAMQWQTSSRLKDQCLFRMLEALITTLGSTSLVELGFCGIHPPCADGVDVGGAMNLFMAGNRGKWGPQLNWFARSLVSSIGFDLYCAIRRRRRSAKHFTALRHQRLFIYERFIQSIYRSARKALVKPAHWRLAL